MSKAKDAEKGAAFKEAYASLNAAQKRAVDTIEGPVMVIAGPGTGKTQILTLRIANILTQTDIKASNILALTFTESGARAMRARLTSLIGGAAYDVAIFTFHGFADWLIKTYPDAFPTIIGGRPASDIEKIEIIETILEDPALQTLRPSGAPDYYVKPILRAIGTLKQEYIEPDSFAESIAKQETALQDIEQFHQKGAHAGKERGEYKEAAKHILRNQTLLQVYRRYQALLREKRLYDFDDMIIELVHALEHNESILRDLQEQYHYVLADEHQDVNASQNKILELITHFHDRPNLFVVGDEKQAIYRFQGASLDNFLYFENVFSGAVTLSLTDNYRSGQEILDFAHDLIKTDDPVLAPLRAPLAARLVDGAEVTMQSFTHQAVENDWLIEAVKAEIEKGVDPNEIAVIVRTNHEVVQITSLLRKRSMTVTPSADSDILHHPITESVRLLLEAVARPSDEAVLFRLLHEPYWDVSISDLQKVLTAKNRHLTLVDLIRNKDLLQKNFITEPESFLRVGIVIDQARTAGTTHAPSRILETLLDTSGLREYVLAQDLPEAVRVLRRLYDEVEAMVLRGGARVLSDVAEQLQRHQAYNVPLTAPFIPTTDTAVHVMTAHKSKGLEFSSVFIPHLTDGQWGKQRSKELFVLPVTRHDVGDFDTTEDDERRLLYVAVTRAKHNLYLSCSEQNSDGREQIQSRFLGEIDEGLYAAIPTEEFAAKFSPLQALSPEPIQPFTNELALETLRTRGLSPTALNNYLKSPWEYLYRNVFRIPQIKSTELQFGTAIHGVLDQLVRSHDGDLDQVTANELSESLKLTLGREAISDEEYTRLHERGLVALTNYLPQLKEFVTKESRSEVKIEAELLTGVPEYPTLKLNGTLDRIDVASGRFVRVVDYKTGKPKTRNVIEGKTKTNHGDYKRQLVFYALLLSLQTDENMHCRTGVISFVEPDKHGVIKEEVFTITDEEIEELRQTLITTTKELIAGEAWQKECDEDACHYCDLVEKLIRK